MSDVRAKVEELLKREGIEQYWLGQKLMVHNGLTSHCEFLIEKVSTDGFNHVIDVAYVTRLEAIVRQVPELVEAIFKYKNEYETKASDILYRKKCRDDLFNSVANLQRVLGGVQK